MTLSERKISFPPEPKCGYCGKRDITVGLHDGLGHYHDHCVPRVRESLAWWNSDSKQEQRVPEGRLCAVVEGLREQNQPAKFDGREGYWVQGDCVFVECTDPATAIDKYRGKLYTGEIGISHNHFADGIREAKLRHTLNTATLMPSRVRD